MWAVGAGGRIAHYDGSSWTVQTAVAGVTGTLRAVWGTSAANVWAVGDAGAVLHYTGSSWTAVSPTKGAGANFRAVWGPDSQSVWLAGADGSLVRWDGTTWALMDQNASVSMNGLWGTSASDVWVVASSGTLLRFNGAFFSPSTRAASYDDLRAIGGSSLQDLWAVGSGGTVLRNATGRWIRQQLPVTYLADFTGLAVRGASDLWFVGGNGQALQWNGLTLQPRAGVLSPGTFSDSLRGAMFLGPSASDLVAVGEGGSVLRYGGSGNAWSRVVTASASKYNAIWGTGLANYWVVGEGGVILRSMGAGLVVDPASGVATTKTLRALWGTGTDATVWAVGDDGLMMQWDGTRWTTSAAPLPVNLNCIWGRSKSDVWAGGDHGAIFHYDGTAWTLFSVRATGNALYSIYGGSDGSVWFAGQQSTILRYQP